MRLDYTSVAPAGVKALGGLYGYVLQSSLPATLVNLVYLRISQINGCAYCIDMHSRDLFKAGFRFEKLMMLPAWRDSGDLFCERERAALAWAESVTRVAEAGVPDEAYAAAAKVFSEKDLVDLTLAIGLMNTYNRLAISFRTVPDTVRAMSVASQPAAVAPAKALVTGGGPSGSRNHRGLAPNSSHEIMARKTQAEVFAGLHAGDDILILPNAWDAASAAIMNDAGARAVATSSGAVAWTHGYPDGNALPLTDLLTSIRAVARACPVPVTADIEGGYTDDVVQLGDIIRAVIGVGAVGVNLEDGTGAPDLHARKIEAARKAAEAEGLPLFINARIDLFLLRLAEGEAAYEEAVRRAELYRSAGASGIFVPGPTEEVLIARLAKAIKLPLNIMLLPGLPDAARLQALGVRRVSSGTAPFRAAYASVAADIIAYLRTGEASALAAGSALPDLNTRFGA